MKFLSNSRLITPLLICGLAAWGQSPQSSGNQNLPTLKANTRLVLVDVIPTDSKGNFVDDLTSGDFKIYEDGKLQRTASIEISNSTTNQVTVSHSAKPASLPDHPAAPAATNPVEPTINIVLLDALNTDMADQLQARGEMLKFLKDLPANQPMIVFVLSGRLHLLQSLTGSTAELIAAIDSVLATKSHLLRTPDDNEQQEADLLQMEELGFPTAKLRQFLAQSDAAGLDMRVVVTCDALRQLARSVARYPGRKNLLWLSGAYPFAVEPDKRLMEPWIVQRNYAPMVQATAAEMARENISVYPIDVRGLVTTALPASTPSIVGIKEGKLAVEERQRAVTDAQSTMQEIAEQTGGKAFYNSNDLKGAIARSINHGNSYYLLSYAPPSGAIGQKFHRIKVEVSRKHLHLDYRRGYYAEGTSIQFNEPQLVRELELAMDRGAPPSTELNVTASVESNKDGAIAMKYLLGSDRLTLRDPQGKPIGISLIASLRAWDRNGRVTAHLVQMVNIPMTVQSADEVQRSGLTSTLNATATLGSSQIRIGVLDTQSGRIGVADVLLPTAPTPEQIKNPTN